MTKAVFLIGVYDNVARRTGNPLSNENLAMLTKLSDDNDLDVTVIFAVEQIKFSGLERNVKLADIRDERSRVVKEIAAAQADIVFCFGKTAASSCFNRGSIVLSDVGRRCHTIDDIGGRVFVVDSLSRVAAQPGIEQWLHMDVKAACDGYGETVWGEYDILLPGTDEWHYRPAHIDPYTQMVGFDLETYQGLDPWQDGSRIRMGMLSTTPGHAVVVQCTPESGFPLWFTEILADDTITKCGSNIAFDVKWCARFGIEVNNVWDTSVAEHLINETNPKKDLKSLTFKYLPRLGDYSYAHRQLVKKRKGWEFVEDHEQYDYAGADAEASIAAALAQRSHIQELGLETPCRMAMDMYPALTQMQIHGACVDTALNTDMEGRFNDYLSELRTRITDVLGPINPGAPLQLAAALIAYIPGIDLHKQTFKQMWQKDDPDDPEDKLSTAKAILLRESVRHPVIKDVLEFRKWTKLYGTYVKGMRDKHFNAHSGATFIHPSFNQNRVETNRLSSSNPNLQNIPRKPGEDDPATLNVKSQFISRFPGGQVLEADFSQAELRVAAWLSGDKDLLKAYDDGVDIHKLTAAKVWHAEDESLVTKDERQKAKTINFGIIYGMGANTLGRALEIEKDEAKVVIKNYLKGYPGLNRYIQRVHRQVRRDLYVVSPFGFKRRFRAPPNGNWNCWEAWAIQRQAFNHVIQNTAACLTFVSIIELAERMKKVGCRSLMIGTVHDSILFDVYPGEMELIAGMAKEVMTNPNTERYGVELGVPMVVDLEVGNNWGQKEEYPIDTDDE
jgi:DNA polymerase I-like protein with 3'-5' exonuclease and polymerase domains